MLSTENTIKNVKIARVSTVAFFVETQLHEQITSLVNSSAKVTVVASEKALEREIPGAQYVSIDIPRKINLVKDFIALIRLWRLFRRSDFEIVHSTTPKAGLLSAVAAKLAGVPVRLHTFTGQPWVELTGLKYFLSKGSDKLIIFLNTHCYADSITQKDFLIQHGVGCDKTLSVLGSGSLAGIDLKRFNSERFSESEKSQLRNDLGIPAKARILLFVGRVSQDKGVYELLAAYQKVVADCADTYLILLGPSEIAINELLNILPESDKGQVITPGFSNTPERFMAIADLLVLPSYREGFGTVVIEAAALGVPTIGTNIYGLSDAIVDGQTGLLVPVKNVDQLTSTIKLLLDDTDFRKKLGQAAKQRVEKEFTNDRLNELIKSEYIRFIKEVG